MAAGTAVEFCRAGSANKVQFIIASAAGPRQTKQGGFFLFPLLLAALFFRGSQCKRPGLGSARDRVVISRGG